RHGVARHRHARDAARGVAVHRDDRAPAGTEDRLSGRNRLSPRVHRRRRPGKARGRDGQQRVRTLPAVAAQGAAGPLSPPAAASLVDLVNVTPTTLPDVLLIEPRVFGDPRGFFYESWNLRDFAASGLDGIFVQDNHSRSVRNVLRGLHYQIEHAQGKLVRVIM